MKDFPIGKKLLNKNSPALIIAEVGLSHDGSLGSAHAFIDAISKTGVDAVKFQTHIASAESSAAESFRVNVFPQDKSRYDYWERTAFSLDQWAGLKRHADDKGILFLSTPFSLEAINLLNKIGIEAWKIGSGEFFSNDMIDKIIKTKKPIIISTGLSKLDEIGIMTAKLKKNKSKFVLMQCTSQYPLKLKEVGINILDTYKKKYKCLFGLSDHTGSIYPSIYAMCKGASIVEVHVGDKNEDKNPDSSSSISFEELKQLCKARNEIHTMKSSNVNKKILPKKLVKIKSIFTKSCTVKNFMRKGQIIKKSDIIFKKPGTGIPEKKINQIIGKKLIKDVFSHNLLKLTDLEK